MFFEKNLKFYDMIKAGDIIEFKSGNQYEVLKVWQGNYVDIKSLKPHEALPDYYPIYYSCQLKHYKILNDSKTVKQGEPNET